MTAATYITEPLDPVVLLLADDTDPERFPEDEDVSEANDDESEDEDDVDAEDDMDEIADEEVE